MSGVYIKGMEMPKSCYDCPLQDDECFGSIKCCYAKTWGSANMRAVDCPLVPVPKHGRLISAELLKADFTGNFVEAYPTALVRAIIDDAPTIIPPEPPKEEDNEDDQRMDH